MVPGTGDRGEPVREQKSCVFNCSPPHVQVVLPMKERLESLHVFSEPKKSQPPETRHQEPPSSQVLLRRASVAAALGY